MRILLWAALMAVAVSNTANALVVTDVQRAVRLVDPGSNFFVHDVRSNALGNFSSLGQSNGSYSSQISAVSATSNQIAVGDVSDPLVTPALIDVLAIRSLTQAETWLTLRFDTDNLNSSVAGAFNIDFSNEFNAEAAHKRLYLFDYSTSQFVFDFSTDGSWSGALAVGHTFELFAYLFADALPVELVTARFTALITETPNQEPSSAPAPGAMTLMLLGLGLAHFSRRRHAA